MMKSGTKMIAVITRESRLQGLKQRWGTSGQVDFLMNAAVDHEVERRRKISVRQGQDLSDADYMLMEEAADNLTDSSAYEEEDARYRDALGKLMRELDVDVPVREVDRRYVPNFDFDRCLAVVVIGQDGLVANVAKYVGDLPVIGVNPDPSRYDGVLLPFQVSEARGAVLRAMKQNARFEKITLAEVNTLTGQRMLAFNDFFVGCRTHASARYTLECGGLSEPQSSSGVLVSTGAGATGWMSSVFNMVAGVSRFVGGADRPHVTLQRDDPRLMWAVREPFASRHSSVNQVMGWIENQDELVIGSQMPTDGVIFSDGIEEDYLEFNSGNIATFTVSQQRARLVVG
ncbi:NAD+ kinase [Blastopirellula marina]|uniref:NAD+ kinase n=1 Tax=Blastopirellula marina TaxID=124 RepID=A0A2S8GC21_9BACT|nr:NAD+ kinase [Blastopirellula marina]PQO41973.1 NAD+ kinase [Blastopirellula marina]